MGYEQPLAAQDPRAEIEAIRARSAVMGANSEEFEQFDNILAELTKGTKGKYKNPEDAVKDAYKILNSKQDYH